MIVQPTYWQTSKYIRVGGTYQYKVQLGAGPMTAPHPGCGWDSWYQTVVAVHAFGGGPEVTVNVT